MRRLLIALTLLTLTSCKKEKRLTIPQQMQYKSFEKEVGYNQNERLDLDDNGTIDVGFRTYHIGDPLYQMDKIQFCAVSMVKSNFPMNGNDDIDIRKSGDLIQTENGAGYEWFQVSLAVLAQKNITNTAPPFWTGTWQNVQHQFLPIQLVKNQQRYNGWIEISFNKTTEKVTVHRSGISRVPEVDIRAGY